MSNQIEEHAKSSAAKNAEQIGESQRAKANPLGRPINWNNAKKLDAVSFAVWNTLTTNFWLPEKINLSADVKSWGTLNDEEQQAVVRVFAGLTLLDTIQSRFGAPALMQDSRSLFEEAVYSNLSFMESVHAKSYSSIFATLTSTETSERAFRWSEENEYLQNKANIITRYYTDETNTAETRLKKKIASVFLESFLFYSGFYLPLYFSSQAKLTGTADIIKLIIRDESVHGYFIGVKFQEEFATLPTEQQDEIRNWAYALLMELYDNEVRYTQEIYDAIGLTEDVKVFLRYNANKALQNLGFDALYASENPNPAILGQLSGQSATHDFFSTQGATYVMGEVEAIEDEDFEF